MKFVLYNHVGSANHGCEALVRTIAGLTGYDNTKLLSDAPAEEKKYGIDKLIEVCPAITKDKKSTIEFLKAYYELKVKKNYFYMDILPYMQALKNINKDDVLVSIGGDIFCYENYPKYILIHQTALKYVNKSILLGCSIEPESLKDEKLVSDLKSFDMITAREHITYNALKSKGLKNVEYCPDSAFRLKCCATNLPKEFKEGKTIGLNLSELVLNKSENPELLMKNFEILIENIISKSEYNIAMVPHVVWKNNDDRVPLKKLYDKYKDTNRVCMIEDHNAEQLKWIISKCAAFIGARTHATIAAYSTRIPTLVLGYSIKSVGIARDLFGSEENYVLSYKNIKKETDLLNHYLWILEHADTIKETLVEKTKEYCAILDKMEEKLKEFK